MLGKKSQVMSIDSTISFLLFVMFLFVIANYIVDISKPYNSYINFEKMYKDSESLNNEFFKTDISREYLDSICNGSFANVLTTNAEYEIDAVVIPGFDAEYNSSKTGIHLKREGDKIYFLFNTNSSQSVQIIFLTTKELSIDEYNLESDDYYNNSRSIDSVVINFFSNSSNDDSDLFVVNIDDNTLFFISSLYSFENIYLGVTPLFYSCGSPRGLSKKSYVYSYGILEELNAIAYYGVDIWWV